jgi:CMP-N-acetylneuraminic acid synthetase
MQNIAIIPLKKTSQRLPGKNLLTLGDKPLFRWAHDKLREISAEYPDLLGTVAIYGGEDIREFVPDGTLWINEGAVPLGQDGNKLFRRMATSVMGQQMTAYDSYTFVNCTAPFVRPDRYHACMYAVATEGYESACTGLILRGRFWQKGAGPKEPGHPLNHDPCTCPRTQEQTPYIMESEACWTVRSKVILETTRRVSTRHKFITATGMDTVDINYQEDFEFAEAIVRSGACPSS